MLTGLHESAESHLLWIPPLWRKGATKILKGSPLNLIHPSRINKTSDSQKPEHWPYILGDDSTPTIKRTGEYSHTRVRPLDGCGGVAMMMHGGSYYPIFSALSPIRFVSQHISTLLCLPKRSYLNPLKKLDYSLCKRSIYSSHSQRQERYSTLGPPWSQKRTYHSSWGIAGILRKRCYDGEAFGVHAINLSEPL